MVVDIVIVVQQIVVDSSPNILCMELEHFFPIPRDSANPSALQQASPSIKPP